MSQFTNIAAISLLSLHNDPEVTQKSLNEFSRTGRSTVSLPKDNKKYAETVKRPLNPNVNESVPTDSLSIKFPNKPGIQKKEFARYALQLLPRNGEDVLTPPERYVIDVDCDN
ncbi:hypothetical protein O9G_000996 [Rozella allomycis CSF55]|uniref:Uncharacterized protein n=1 Tax=Rozella allomycis (strain CSF55) TaxID=988480 RepID=A0A075ARK1_ROZAC|nr:hypothetical protein O9G_000996 [Rozella allomycis CSF55]|eukprot:EPZ31351.1 hypothetical protein O9G_000996 [Rozella allomycis CSF55]